MKLTLYYGDLSRAADHSNKLASELDDYCDSLSKKAQKKMYSVEGGMSSTLNTADYYVNQKIRNLRTKSSNARTLARQINNLLGTAKRVDSDVKSTIEANQKNLFQKHADLRPSNAQLYLTSFLCDMKNVPVIGALIRGKEAIDSGIDHLKKEIRYWYKCEGGKEYVGIVLSAVGAVLAAVAVVCALVFSGGTILAVIAGVAGFIGALIGFVNSVTNVVTSFQAYEAATGGHPGQAKIYAGQDKLSDVMRDRNYHDRDKNRFYNSLATGLDITETICDVIGIINGINNAVTDLKGVNLKKTFRAICQPRNADGTFAPGKPTIWNGLKTLTTKINGKDMILGDLNVKNLSRISLLSQNEALKSIGKLNKAAQGIVKDFDKINEGNMNLKEFIAKRFVVGLNKSMFQEEKWVTKEDKKGNLYSTFDKTNFAKIINGLREPIDKLGVSKFLIDLPKNDTLSNIIASPSGVIDKIKDYVKTLNQWLPPTVELDSSLQETRVSNWSSAQGYSTVRVVTPEPVIVVNPVPSVQSYILPSVQLNISSQYRYPYLNLAD